jgi:hypothetical protein
LNSYVFSGSGTVDLNRIPELAPLLLLFFLSLTVVPVAPPIPTPLSELFKYTPAVNAMCVEVDSHPDGLNRLAGKYGVVDHNTLTRLKREDSPTGALLLDKRGMEKHTIEELAGFLVDLEMETTARRAMVDKLCVIDVSNSPDLATLRACGERLSDKRG